MFDLLWKYMEATSNVERKLDVTLPGFIWGNIHLQIENVKKKKKKHSHFLKLNNVQ